MAADARPVGAGQRARGTGGVTEREQQRGPSGRMTLTSLRQEGASKGGDHTDGGETRGRREMGGVRWSRLSPAQAAELGWFS